MGSMPPPLQHGQQPIGDFLAQQRQPSPNGAPKPRAIDRVRKAYHSILRQHLSVPEWSDEDGTPLDVFFSALTPRDVDAIQARDGVKERTPREQQVDLLIAKLKDEEGRPLFNLADKPFLMDEGEFGVILRLNNAIWALSSIQSVDEAKNILGDDQALQFRMALAEHLHKSLDEINVMPMSHLMLWAAHLTLKAEREDAARFHQ